MTFKEYDMYTHNTTGKASRSGKQHTYTGEGYDSWKGLSPNGKQYKNEDTMICRDLDGADYWHMRKELSPDLRDRDVIRASDYKTPSYYHTKKEITLNVATECEFEVLNVVKGEAKSKDSFVPTIITLGLVIAGAVLFHLL